MNCATPIPPAEEINLDCFVSPEELDPFIENKSLPENVRRYAKQKKAAMTHRLAGQIQEAIIAESNCDALFKHIPEPYRW